MTECALLPVFTFHIDIITVDEECFQISKNCDTFEQKHLKIPMNGNV